MVGCCLDCFYTAVHADVPELDFAAAAPADEFALSAALEVDVGDPLFVLFPDLDHGCGGLLALVVDADCSVAETSYKDIAFDLVGCQGSNT